MLSQCLTEKAKHDLTDLTGNDFSNIIFAGASTIEPRGVCDAFTQEELQTIAASEPFRYWTDYNKDWVWNAID